MTVKSVLLMAFPCTFQVPGGLTDSRHKAANRERATLEATGNCPKCGGFECPPALNMRGDGGWTVIATTAKKLVAAARYGNSIPALFRCLLSHMTAAEARLALEPVAKKLRGKKEAHGPSTVEKTRRRHAKEQWAILRTALSRGAGEESPEEKKMWRESDRGMGALFRHMEGIELRGVTTDAIETARALGRSMVRREPAA